jgi:hypothetical protein
MSKDVNIHVKTEGTGQVNRDLQEVAQGVNKVGENVEQMGSRSSRALEWFANGIKSLAGPLGFAALIGAVSNVAGKISQFFNDLKNRCDEAVTNLQNVRKSFEGVFEAMDAFDEKSRRAVLKQTTELLKKTSVTPEIGLPVIEQYARQFKGKLPPEQYQQGLEGMLGYAERHGKMATPELITLMSGFGMTTPEQQGTFRRQIGAVSKASGLTDEDIIAALGRASPATKAMGWKPEETLNYIGTIAAGEIGRNKSTLPSATLEALANPQLGNLKDYRISPKQAGNPAQLFDIIASRRGKMTEQAFSRMLTDFYGAHAAAGVAKLIKTPGGAMGGTIQEAATPQAAAAETTEEMTSRDTMERIEAQTRAVKTEIQQDVTDKENYQQKIRDIGADEQKNIHLRHPFIQWLYEHASRGTGLGITPAILGSTLKGEGTKKENAAFIRWLRNLAPEERTRILQETTPPSIPFVTLKAKEFVQLGEYYHNLTPKQQYQELVGNEGPRNFESSLNPTPVQQSERSTGPPTVNDNHIEYNTNFNYYPVAGTAGERDIGPRADRTLR